MSINVHPYQDIKRVHTGTHAFVVMVVISPNSVSHFDHVIADPFHTQCTMCSRFAATVGSLLHHTDIELGYIQFQMSAFQPLGLHFRSSSKILEY